MIAVRRAREGAQRFERLISTTSASIIVAALTFESTTRDELPVAELQQSLEPAIWLCAGAFAMGWAVSLIAGATVREAATIAIELCVKNTVLGLVLATTSFDVLDPAIPIAAFMTFQLLGAAVSIALLWLWNRVGARAEAA